MGAVEIWRLRLGKTVCISFLFSLGGDPEDLSAFVIPESCDTTSDLLIAQMVQLQMDDEHDRQLKREEAKWNGTSKGRFRPSYSPG